MSGATILLVQVGNSPSGNKFSLCKPENYQPVSNQLPYDSKIILVSEPKQEPQELTSYELDTPVREDVKPIDLRVSPEPCEQQTDAGLDDSEKYLRIRLQNSHAAKRNRIRKKSSGSESGDSKSEKHTRRPRMDLSQMDDAAKYKRIRELNNMASKRLREKKRQLMQNASEELVQLGRQNSDLKTRLNNLQAVKDELRQLLLQTSK